MKTLFEHTSCLILAAGKSERMGEPKALLKFDNDTTFVERIAKTYAQAGIEQIVIVVNSELLAELKERTIDLPSGINLVLNDKPELGRFYSLKTGVQQVSTGHSCFLQNIDNPFTSLKILEELFSHKNESDVIVPNFHNKSGHPILLCPAVLDEIRLFKTFDERIDQFLKNFKVRKIEISDERILVNINSMEDYQNSGFVQ